jgi:hypothetical protein
MDGEAYRRNGGGDIKVIKEGQRHSDTKYVSLSIRNARPVAQLVRALP